MALHRHILRAHSVLSPLLSHSCGFDCGSSSAKNPGPSWRHHVCVLKLSFLIKACNQDQLPWTITWLCSSCPHLTSSLFSPSMLIHVTLTLFLTLTSPLISPPVPFPSCGGWIGANPLYPGLLVSSSPCGSPVVAEPVLGLDLSLTHTRYSANLYSWFGSWVCFEFWFHSPNVPDRHPLLI